MRRAAVALLLLTIAGSASAQVVPAQWHLAARPTVTIGGEGNSHTEFLRVGRAMRLPGGQIVVSNGGTSEIRIFDKSGAFLRSIGRRGAGPGEFRDPHLLDSAGDTLFIEDNPTRRITLVRVDGTLLKTIPIPGRDPAGAFIVDGRLRNGRWLVSTVRSPNIYGPERTYRDSARIGTLAPNASGDVVWLTVVPGMTFFVHNPTNAAHGDIVGVVPLAPKAVSVVSGDEVIIGNTGDNVIGSYADTGAVLHLITLPLTALPLTDAKIAQARKLAVDQNPSERSRPWLNALYSRGVMGRSLPVFFDLVPGPESSLWVQAGPTDPATAALWLVLDLRDPEGKPRATLSSPPGFRITEVGADYVLGVHTDADGVETVQLYSLGRRS